MSHFHLLLPSCFLFSIFFHDKSCKQFYTAFSEWPATSQTRSWYTEIEWETNLLKSNKVCEKKSWIHCIWNCHETKDRYWKISRYLGRIRTGSSYLNRTLLIWVFGHFWLFLRHGIEEKKRSIFCEHRLKKFNGKVGQMRQRNTSLASVGFLHKVVHQNSRLWKFNRAREIEFNFITAWTISMKLGRIVHHVPGCKTLPKIVYFLPIHLVLWQSFEVEWAR